MKSTQSHHTGCTSWTSWWWAGGAICLALVASLLPVAGCEKQGDAPQESAAPTPEAAAERPATPTATSATATPERDVDAHPTPRSTAQPLESPRKDQPKPTAGAAKPATESARRAASPISQADQQQVAKLSADAGLPAPPDLTKLSADIAMHLRSTIEQAAKERSAEKIGKLGCLYFNIMRSRDDSKRVLDCFERTREIDPESYVWPHLLGRVFMRRQSFIRAQIEFSKSMELNPDYLDNYIWTANLALRTNDVEEAESLFRRFLELSPDEPSGLAGLAATEMAQNKMDSAFEHLQEALRLDPVNRRTHTELAEYHRKVGDEQRAARHEGFAQDMDPAPVTRNDPISMLLLRAGGPTSFAINRMRTLATTGELEVADTLRDHLLADHPDNALLLTGVAEMSLVIGRTEEAADYAHKALVINPKLSRAWVILADCQLAQGNTEDAIKQAEHALVVDPGSPGAHIAKARALRMLGRNDEALASFQEASKLQPDNIQLKTTIGEMMRGLGKLEEAKDWCSKLVRGAEADGEVPAVYAPAYTTLANIAYVQDDATAAVEGLKRALVTDPTREPVFQQLAGLLIELGRSDEALAIGQDLTEGQPHLLDYAITYGNLLAMTGKRDEGIKHLEQLSDEVPHHPAPHMALAMILLEQDRLDDAEKHLNKVIELQDNHEGAHMLLVDIARRRKDPDAAFAAVERAVEKVPNSTLLANSLAWMLATTPDESRRDPQRAVDVAENMVARTGRRVPNYLDTLACAYAAAGRFDDAVNAQKEAIALSEEVNSPDLVAQYQERIKLFEKKEAYVETQ